MTSHPRVSYLPLTVIPRSSQRLFIAPQTILASITIGFFHSGTAWWSRHTEWRWKSRVGTDRVGRDFWETVVTASRERRERETAVKSFQGAWLDICTRNHRRRLLKCSKGQKSQRSICMQRGTGKFNQLDENQKDKQCRGISSNINIFYSVWIFSVLKFIYKFKLIS